MTIQLAYLLGRTIGLVYRVREHLLETGDATGLAKIEEEYLELKKDHAFLIYGIKPEEEHEHGLDTASKP